MAILCIGNLDNLFFRFFLTEIYSAEPPRVSIVKELSEKSENRGFAPASSGGAVAGSARLARRRAARSNSERAAAKDCVGRLVFGCQIVWNRSTRRAGERGGARGGSPKWLRILTITGGSSMAAMIFKAPPQLGQCSMSMSKTRLSSRAQLMRAGTPCP